MLVPNIQHLRQFVLVLGLGRGLSESLLWRFLGGRLEVGKHWYVHVHFDSATLFLRLLLTEDSRQWLHKWSAA